MGGSNGPVRWLREILEHWFVCGSQSSSSRKLTSTVDIRLEEHGLGDARWHTLPGTEGHVLFARNASGAIAIALDCFGISAQGSVGTISGWSGSTNKTK